MEDNAIIELLFERSDTALAELGRKYSRLYRGTIREVLANESDIDEAENDLLLAIWKSIPPNRPRNLAAYVCALARRIGVDKLRYNTRLKRGAGYTLMLSELDDIADTVSDELPDGRIVEILDGFISGLDAETQILFVRRYVYLESVTSLAERFEMSENHVSVKLYRARKRLKKILEEEGIII